METQIPQFDTSIVAEVKANLENDASDTPSANRSCISDLKSNKDSNSSSKNLKWYEAGEHRRIIQNVVLISFIFEVLFTAVIGMMILQSSIIPDGLGVYAMSLSHVFIVISAMFLPTLIIQRITPKYAMVLTMFTQIPFFLAQFYPNFWTLIPSSIFVGIFGSTLWAAKCTYLTHVGHIYAEKMGVSPEAVVVRFFGVFFLFFHFASIWGNLISAVVLSTPGNQESGIDYKDMNMTFIISPNSTKDISICGRNFCPIVTEEHEVITRPPSGQINTLVGLYLGLNLLAIVMIILFVDPLSRFGQINKAEKKSSKSAIAATFRQMMKLRQLLLIPLTLWCGINIGFYLVDFTRAFVACTLGVENIGRIGMVFGICDAISSFGFGVIVKRVGRLPVFTFGALLNASFVITLMIRNVESLDYIFLMIIAGLWGLADSIWQTQINGLYGVLFKNDSEAAFSNFRLWESLGFIIGLVNGNLLCVQLKLYILLSGLALGMIGYYTVEYLERIQRKKTKL